MKNEPIIIIGAGRSGTNILRDTICRVEGYATWPCDEIKYIWQKGNLGKNSDRFTEKDVRPEIARFIKQQFKKIEAETGADFIVEKTCANSLKVPFIHSIFPNAKFVFIIRDGLDVASSAKQRWTAPLELDYIFKKAKFVPTSDIPFYATSYLKNRLKKVFSKEKRLATWGPVYDGMQADLRRRSLIEVCLLQWKHCVETAYQDLQHLEKGNVHYLKYEDFVLHPENEMMKVFQFLNCDITEEDVKKAIGKVSPKSIGNYKKHLSKDEIERLNDLAQETMNNIYNAL